MSTPKRRAQHGHVAAAGLPAGAPEEPDYPVDSRRRGVRSRSRRPPSHSPALPGAPALRGARSPARPRLFVRRCRSGRAPPSRAGAAQPGGPGRAGRTGGGSSEPRPRPRPRPSPSRRNGSGRQGLTTDRHLGAHAGAVSPPPNTPLPVRGCGAVPRTLSPRRAGCQRTSFCSYFAPRGHSDAFPSLSLGPPVHSPALSPSLQQRRGRRSGAPDPAPLFPGLARRRGFAIRVRAAELPGWGTCPPRRCPGQGWASSPVPAGSRKGKRRVRDPGVATPSSSSRASPPILSSSFIYKLTASYLAG